MHTQRVCDIHSSNGGPARTHAVAKTNDFQTLGAPCYQNTNEDTNNEKSRPRGPIKTANPPCLRHLSLCAFRRRIERRPSVRGSRRSRREIILSGLNWRRAYKPWFYSAGKPPLLYAALRAAPPARRGSSPPSSCSSNR